MLDTHLLTDRVVGSKAGGMGGENQTRSAHLFVIFIYQILTHIRLQPTNSVLWKRTRSCSLMHCERNKNLRSDNESYKTERRSKYSNSPFSAIRPVEFSPHLTQSGCRKNKHDQQPSTCPPKSNSAASTSKADCCCAQEGRQEVIERRSGEETGETSARPYSFHTCIHFSNSRRRRRWTQ